MKKYFHITYVLLLITGLLAIYSFTKPNFSEEEEEKIIPVPFASCSDEWVDSIMNQMTLREKIGQLIMIAAYSNRDKEHEQEIIKQIEKYGIGGLIFMQGGPVREANLTNTFQAASKVPLMIAIDGEWGLAMRLDSTVKYPRQMMIGAIQDNEVVYQMGREIGQQCKRMGIHVNFAPVVDVNVNPKNPVINSRSFGELKENVAAKGIAYMKGLQDVGVLANAKHFPGHGDTDTDSHKALPIIPHSYERIDSIELYPFKQLIKNGLGSMMVAHLYIPSLDNTENQASTLSPKIVNGLLKDSLGFEGLIFTDALNMKGVSAYYKPGEVDLMAFKAGNDVLLFSGSVKDAISQIEDAVKDGSISEEEVSKRCRKILSAKKWLGLDELKPVETKNLVSDLNDLRAEAVNRSIVANAMTLIKNENNLLPITGLDTLNIATLVIGDMQINEFQVNSDLYARATHFNLPITPNLEQFQATLAAVDSFDLVLVGISGTNRRPSRNFGIRKEVAEFVQELSLRQNVVLSFFANPYVLDEYDQFFAPAKAIICAYEDTPLSREYASQVIFGGCPASGKLPVSAGSYKAGHGLTTGKYRLGYYLPENVGMDSHVLAEVDSIALEGINAKAYPGCQILIARKGEVIYNKSFGHHTYEKKRPVVNSDVYDLASVTKIVSSVGAIMYLVDHDLVNLDSTLGTYLDYVDSTEYENLVIRDILAHQARLVSWIPFYQKTLVKGQLRYDLYSPVKTEEYSNQVADKVYIIKAYEDSIKQRILKHPLHKQTEYRYSDLGYYFMKDIIESQTGMPLNEFVDKTYYAPLGAFTTTYNPLEKIDIDRIPPTEYDLIFRKQLVKGYVHDPGAAMMGGVGGHAGVFSSANDLAKVMQMYLNQGEYGGQRFIDTAVVNEFTKCQFCADDNRRGAGFDKPSTTNGGPTCSCISYQSFGHSGFTGTYAWADPDKEIVYIFLSNRVYPDANNKKLIRMDIRTRIMEVIYNSFLDQNNV